MKKLTRPGYAFLCFAALGTLYTESIGSAYGAESHTGWSLLQFSRLSGKHNVELDSNHVKMENQKTGLVSLLTGPPWKAYFYNKHHQVIFGTDLAHLHDTFEDGFTGDAELDLIQETPLQKANNTQLNIAGLRSQHFFMRNPKALIARRARPKTYREQFSGLPSIEPVPMASIDYWVALDIHVPMQVTRFICEIYKMPRTTLVPLRLKAQDAIARQTIELDTFRCVEGKISPSEFAIPKGFRQAKSFREVMFDEDVQSQTIEMMQGMMGNEDEDKKSSRSDKPKKPAR